MVSRRGFLGAMLAACAAPAIVRADSLMKIVVPKREIITLDGLVSGSMDGDFTVEMWTQKQINANEGWHHFAISRSGDHQEITLYKDGVATKDIQDFKKNWMPIKFDGDVTGGPFLGQVDEIRVTNGVAREVNWLLVDQTRERGSRIIAPPGFNMLNT